MLVLSREKMESIQVGEATIVILRLNRHRCRIGITAPPHVVISRKEVEKDGDSDKPAT